MVRLRRITPQELGYYTYAPQPIIDVETIDTFSNPSIVGIFHQDQIIQIILHHHQNKKQFKKLIQKELDKLPQPFLAFNKNFDQKVLADFIGKKYRFEEIQEYPYQKKQHAKIKHNIKVDDPFHGQGSLAMFYYQKFLQTNNQQFLNLVIDHNTACLLTENFLWQKKQLPEKFALTSEIDQLMRDYHSLKLKLKSLQEQEAKLKQQLLQHLESTNQKQLENELIFLHLLEREQTSYPKELIEKEIPPPLLEKIKQIKTIKSLISRIKTNP